MPKKKKYFIVIASDSYKNRHKNRYFCNLFVYDFCMISFCWWEWSRTFCIYNWSSTHPFSVILWLSEYAWRFKSHNIWYICVSLCVYILVYCQNFTIEIDCNNLAHLSTMMDQTLLSPTTTINAMGLPLSFLACVSNHLFVRLADTQTRAPAHYITIVSSTFSILFIEPQTVFLFPSSSILFECQLFWLRKRINAKIWYSANKIIKKERNAAKTEECDRKTSNQTNGKYVTNKITRIIHIWIRMCEYKHQYWISVNMNVNIWKMSHFKSANAHIYAQSIATCMHIYAI